MRSVIVKILIGLVAFSGAVGAAPKALQRKLQLGGGITEFEAVGNPSALKIVGKGEGAKGVLSLRFEDQVYKLFGTVDVDLRTFVTGVALRDRHLKSRYLEVDSPEIESASSASLEISPLRIADDRLKGEEIPFEGTLRLHGQRRKIAGKVQLTGDVFSEVDIVAKFSISLPDFAIKIPEFAGITVAREVKVVARTTASNESSASPSPLR